MTSSNGKEPLHFTVTLPEQRTPLIPLAMISEDFKFFWYLRHLAWKEERQRDTGASNATGGSLGQEFVSLPQSRKLMFSVAETAPDPTSQKVEGSFSDKSDTEMEEVSSGFIKEPGTKLETEGMTPDWPGGDRFSWDEKQKEESDWPTLTEEDDPWSFCGTKSSEDFWGETSSCSNVKPEITQTDGQESNGEGCAKPKVKSNARLDTGSGCESKVATKIKKESSQPTDKPSPPKIEEEDNKPLSQPVASSHSHAEVEEPKTSKTTEVIDPRCLDEENQGNILVADDSDDSDCDWPEDRTKWLPVRKQDPVTIHEHLQLTLEEAFFLSYGLGCLMVLDENNTPLDLVALWHRFCAAHNRFIPNYVAYHYFRSKGWVPKVGLKYGAEYVLYKDGPPFYHSSFSVTVRPVCDSDLHDNPIFASRPLTWRSLSGLNRVTEQVSKEVLLCYVIRPADLLEEDLLSPNCIKQFKVQEVVLKRWVPTKEREREEETEIS